MLLDAYSSTKSGTRPKWRYFAPLVFICATASMANACGSPVSRGTVLYRQQNYIEAAEAFERTQERLVTMQPVERARYGLYRGLTFMALGDLRSAGRWLDYADGLQRTQPMLLPADERDLLARGRRELSQLVRESWPKPENNVAQRVAASAVANDVTLAR